MSLHTDIEAMIEKLKSNVDHDNEALHIEYDKLLERFILDYDYDLMYLMKELIAIQKNFWYA